MKCTAEYWPADRLRARKYARAAVDLILKAQNRPDIAASNLKDLVFHCPPSTAWDCMAKNATTHELSANILHPYDTPLWL